MVKSLLALLGVVAAFAQIAPAPLVIDYPADGTVFPPDMAAPTFLWRDPARNDGPWQIEVAFADRSAPLHVASKGERMQIGEIDPRCVSSTNKLPELTPEQAAAHTWKPDAATWAAIKQPWPSGHHHHHAVASHARAHCRSSDKSRAIPVGAPIFYRDVPLMPSEVRERRHQAAGAERRSADRLAPAQRRRAEQPRR